MACFSSSRTQRRFHSGRGSVRPDRSGREGDVKQAWRSYGLQALLLHVRVRAATLGQARGGKRTRTNHAALITGVKPANARSAANTAELGFEPLATPSPALFMACASCRTPPAPDSGRDCCCGFWKKLLLRLLCSCRCPAQAGDRKNFTDGKLEQDEKRPPAHRRTEGSPFAQSPTSARRCRMWPMNCGTMSCGLRQNP